MKRLSIFLVGTLFGINNVMAGTVSEYLLNKSTKASIAQNLISDPNAFEQKLAVLAQEIQVNNFLDSSENRVKILALEKEITHTAIGHNQSAKDKNQVIRVAGVVIGAVIGGVAGYKMAGGSIETSVIGRNATETFANTGREIFKAVKVVGVSLLSASAGAVLAYGASKTSLASQYLTIQEIDLNTINLDTKSID